MSRNDLLPQSEADKFLHLPYDDRREQLKPIIVQLYMGRRDEDGKFFTMTQVAEFMKFNYGFHAAESQYKRWFSPKVWNIRKRTLTSEKEGITQALGRRKRDQASTSNVVIKQGQYEKEVDAKQLKRHLKDQIRKFRVEPLVPGVLSSWNLPYAALKASVSRASDYPSPFGPAVATPDYLTVNDPAATTPGRSTDAPSPTTQLVRESVLCNRASLLFQGRRQDLLGTLGAEDRVTLTNYLHDFYIQSFVTAKYWGRGPRTWTADMVSALTLSDLDGTGRSPGSPASIARSPATSPLSNEPQRPPRLDPPTSLCRWVIHVDDVSYEPIDPGPREGGDHEGFDIDNTDSWPEWTPDEARSASFIGSLESSIVQSSFTSLPETDIPISTQALSQSLRDNPTSLDADAWKLAIMTGNAELLRDLFEKNGEDIPDSVLELHPLHLAASYLDGGKVCCHLISTLHSAGGYRYLFRHPIDDLGFTFLDRLLVSILRSHTSIPPNQVSPQLGTPGRFPGEEKDMCGRWDADTPAVRKLFQDGNFRIPSHWKHPFCHSSAQAVCHSVIAIFGPPRSPDIDSKSGLFVRRCSHCGSELKLGSLHAIVATSFHLAQSGMAGETLFGSLALLVCLLRLGADVNSLASISVEDVLGTADPSRCCHAEMSARQLLESVPHLITSEWSGECQRGWDCLRLVLLLGEKGSIAKSFRGRDNSTPQATEDDFHIFEEPSSISAAAFGATAGPLFAVESDSQSEAGSDCQSGEEGEICCQLKDFHTETYIEGGNADLGVLWATIQTELLTYRRISHSDPWISRLFSIPALQRWLSGETDQFRTPMLVDGLMRSHTTCGWFEGTDVFCPIAQEACKSHFMNMDAHVGVDLYSRTTFLERPGLSDMWASIYF